MCDLSTRLSSFIGSRVDFRIYINLGVFNDTINTSSRRCNYEGGQRVGAASILLMFALFLTFFVQGRYPSSDSGVYTAERWFISWVYWTIHSVESEFSFGYEQTCRTNLSWDWAFLLLIRNLFVRKSPDIYINIYWKFPLRHIRVNNCSREI